MFGLAMTTRMTHATKYWFRIRDDTVVLHGDLRYKALFVAETCNEKAWYLLNSQEGTDLFNLIQRKTLCEIKITGFAKDIFQTKFTIKDCWEMILNPDIVLIHDPLNEELAVIDSKSFSQYFNKKR